MSTLLRRLLFSAIALAVLAVLAGPVYARQASEPVVHAVLFYSPTCQHCEDLMQNWLPPQTWKYGSKLVIAQIDATRQPGQALYEAAVQRFAVPKNRQAVPLLVISTQVLLGADEIPQQLPGLIESGLARGGIAWPDIPGFPAEPPLYVPRTPTPIDRFNQDPAANGVALLVLLGLLVTAGYFVVRFRPIYRDGAEPARWQVLAIPVAALAALGISIYLAQIELTNMPAYCGPLGDCPAVHQSPYARLFGLIPIGVIGIASYSAVLVTWLAGYFGRGWLSTGGWLALAAGLLGGTGFAIYLTTLEPFVIGATCMWCVSVAVLTATMLWLAAPLGQRAWGRLLSASGRQTLRYGRRVRAVRG